MLMSRKVHMHGGMGGGWAPGPQASQYALASMLPESQLITRFVLLVHADCHTIATAQTAIRFITYPYYHNASEAYIRYTL